MTDLKNTQQPKKFMILLIGDNCIDEYKIGSVDRLSPEAPVPVVKIIKEYKAPGMATNVHINLMRLNCEMIFLSHKEQIIKTRFIDERSGQHLLRVDEEPKLTPWPGEFPFTLEHFDAIVISDYNKGFLTYENIEKIRKEFNGPIFLDTKKPDLSRFNGIFVKINELEYKSRTSTNDTLIVTLGSRGAMLKQNDNEKMFPGRPSDVVDVCGCGDTFLAALTYQYLMTKSLDDAIIFANKAASITVKHSGNYAPFLEEITNA
jgi:D-beta-D-heptose 7-phosphate kinase/D-beta-D-heptose 1-phosphate adenosyltransferase